MVLRLGVPAGVGERGELDLAAQVRPGQRVRFQLA
ncbi:biotin-dependent carboxyltransferase family protein [Amycolatopsis roodepoortensis]|uniref:Allophanate hydrolase subunit 2 n=1 Tax=Amycolatopsis roodepoortensis TaxID=700274 RepID=A0ABR9L6S5_9PSEU|nr:biotin-dependent carboxyltransferase family protein [Amycolatopsis roodepoortensis]MBE1576413.1 allophanate hydrolase subunit 2 [Amycolatopsis roodepoortensis]